jgi:hypothetical protein
MYYLIPFAYGMGEHDNLCSLLFETRKCKSKRNEESLVSCIKISVVICGDLHSQTYGIRRGIARLTLLRH